MGTRTQQIGGDRPPPDPADHFADDARRAPETNGAEGLPFVSVVVPTRNERDNIEPLVAALEKVLPSVAVEVIFGGSGARE